MRTQVWFDHQRYFGVIIKYLMINILLPGTSPPEPDRRTTVMGPNGIARRNLCVGFKWVTNYNIVVWEEKYRRFFSGHPIDKPEFLKKHMNSVEVQGQVQGHVHDHLQSQSRRTSEQQLHHCVSHGGGLWHVSFPKIYGEFHWPSAIVGSLHVRLALDFCHHYWIYEFYHMLILYDI